MTSALNTEIVDTLGLKRICERLGYENTEHYRYNISECVGQLEHNDGERDGRPLAIFRLNPLHSVRPTGTHSDT